MKAYKWKWQEDGFTVYRSICWSPPGCHGGCGILLYTKNGRLIKVEGDRSNPFNNGQLCIRGLSLPQMVYNKKRLTYPMKRMGRRGENEWKRISWSEALNTIEGKLKKIKTEFGPQSVIFCKGTGRDISPYLSMLAYGFGSSNYFAFGPASGNACFMPRTSLLKAIMGDYAVADCSQFFPDRYKNPKWKLPKCILIWGCNPIYSNPDGFLGSWIVDCLKKGSKLIVIDPRLTWLASRAHLWLQIRPGTDGALALGMLNIIIAEGIYDKTFVSNWIYGFESLRDRVKSFSPERVSEITGIPEQRIKSAARLYAQSKPAACQWGVSVDMTTECIPISHGIFSLWAITGNIETPGGMVIAKDPFNIPRRGVHESDICGLGDKIGVKRYPLFNYGVPYGQGDELIEQMISGCPYEIKVAWIQGTNTIVSSFAAPRRVYDAFKKLEFIVVADVFMTPTAYAFADILLPVALFPERDGIRNWWYQLVTINKAIDPPGEAKSDMEIVLETGRRLVPNRFCWNSVQDMFSSMIKCSGHTFESLREHGPLSVSLEYKRYERGKLRADKKTGFNTPTGKIEVYSTILKSIGLDPLPYYEEPLESPFSRPDIAALYPLILTTGARVPWFFHSEHHNIKGLKAYNPDPLIEIHPDTARKYHINEKDWVIVESSYGKCKRRASLTYGIRQDVVNAQHAWWYPEMGGGKGRLFGVWEYNINNLLPCGQQGKSGFGYPFRSQMCRVYKA